MSEHLAVRVLGTVELVGDRASRHSLSGRLRRLLAALLVSAGTVVSTDRLIDILWLDELPADPEAALHSLTSRLRTRLRELAPIDGSAPAELLTRSPGYLLDLRAGALDAQCFETGVRAAREELAERPREAAVQLMRALELWRGPAYAEFADDEFARPEAARLEQLRLAAVEDRFEAALRCGDHGAAVADLEAFVAVEPLRERPHRQLMLALYRSGRQADALTVAREYRDRLVDELGLDPSPELQRFEQQILRHDEALDVPHGPAIPPELQSAPADATGTGGLLGREDDLNELIARLRPGSVLTLTGPGGVGKTSLARAAASRTAPDFADGPVIVELAAVSSGDEVASAASTALSLQPRSELSATERVVDALSGQRRLLVLDNCEHVLDAAGDLAEAVVGGCPAVAVLATSRSPLDLSAEQLFAVGPLAVPSAVELFATRAAARERAFALDDGNAADVAEICRRLDGLPLAIELAAARMTAMTPGDLVHLLSWRFTLLRGGRRTADRHKSLRAVVDWSYDMLDDENRFAFEVLTVFAGSFTLPEADALLSGAAAAFGRSRNPGAGELLGLLDRSMITVAPRTGTTTRYVLLETLRAYGRERLQVRDPHLLVRRAHADLYADLAAEAGARLYRPGHLAAVARLDAAFDELRAAWTWGLEHDLDLAARLIGALALYVELRVPAEIADWSTETLAVVDRSDDHTVGRVQRAALLAVAATTVKFAGDLDRARALAERGLAVLEPESDPTDVSAYLWYVLSEIALFQGRLTEISGCLAQIRSLQPTGMVAVLSESDAHLAAAYAGDVETAIEGAEQALRDLDPEHDALHGWVAYVAAEVQIDVHPQRAGALLREALDEARTNGDRYLQGVALVAAAALQSRHGSAADAVPLFLDVIEHWRALGDWLHQWSTLRNVRDLLLRSDRLVEAAELHGAVTARADRFPVFGADAGRAAEARELLQCRLGVEEFAVLGARGARLSDLEVVDLARAALLRT